MEIQYLGHSSFKIKTLKVGIVTDPFDSVMVGMKFPKTEGDIVTISHSHADHNKIDEVSGVKRVVEGPGEYEIMGVSIIGIASYHDNQKGLERGKNTIFIFELEGLRVAHLGDLGHVLSESTLSDMGDIDVLLIPVGGVYTIDATQAVEITKKIEPNIVIPMHYKTPDHASDTFEQLQPVDDFVKQLGLRVETLPKLVAKEGAQFEEEQKIVILEKR
jgi:L-ascorbate metabolism protein UlaG (beta-lactamase superfamily)